MTTRIVRRRSSLRRLIGIGAMSISIWMMISAMLLSPSSQAASPAVDRASAASASNVSIVSYAFNPAVITVSTGSTMKWANTAAIAHTTTSLPGDNESWNSDPIAPSAAFTKTFTLPGVYAYQCLIHPSMLGTVSVTPTLSVCPGGCSFSTIQAAINAAQPNDSIFVAAGNYTESIVITKSIGVYGGFSGPPVWKLDRSIYTSTIVGNDAQSVVAITGPLTITIDGFAITKGRGTPIGGGLRSIDAILTVRNSLIANNGVTATIFSTNAFGAGIYAVGGSFLAANNVFRSNTNSCSGLYCPVMDGGGLYVADMPTATLSNNIFDSNHAWTGSGVGSLNTSIVADNNLFKDSSGGGGYGGGLYTQGGGSIIVRHNTFANNIASSRGVALDIHGPTNFILSGNVITGQVGDGATIYASSDHYTVTNNLIEHNVLMFYVEQAIVDLDTNDGLNGWIVNNTFADNRTVTQTTPVLLLDSGGHELDNNLFFSQTTAISVTSTSVVTLSHNAFYSSTLNWGGPGTIVVGSGNLTNTNPRFVNPAADYHLQRNSPLIDAGVNTFAPTDDLDGNPRWGFVDIGAYEFVLKVYLPLTLKNY